MATSKRPFQVSTRATKSLLYVSFSVAILPILLTPPLMDVRWWFIRVPADLNYSVSSIPAFWISEVLPGRFVPISDFWGYAYIYVGHKFLQITQSPVNYFDLATKLALIVALYFALRSLIRELGPNLSFDSIKTCTLILLTIWGLGANVFWQLNGTVAYPSLIYPTIIIAIVFAAKTLKNIRASEFKSFPISRGIIVLLIASTLWANFYYELAYTAIVAIIAAIAVSPKHEFDWSKRIKLAGLFLVSFLVVWIPMRIVLARQCSADLSECYDGSELNLAGAPATFLKNLVNAHPLTDYSALESYQNGNLPFVISGVTLLVAAFISLSVILNFRLVASSGIKSTDRYSEVLIMQVRLTTILLAVGVFAAAIMSVSGLSQRTVKWGYAYRHAPVLWLGYASLVLMLIIFVLTRTNAIIAALLMILLIAILTTGQWARSLAEIRNYNKSFEPVSRLYHELYNADTRMAGQGNERRCLIVKELSSKEVNLKRYIEPSEKFMITFHNVPFCK
jgi:hypothetical protein